MFVSQEDPVQKARSQKLFHAVINGQRAIKSDNDAKLFLCSLRSLDNVVSSAERLVASTAGLQAVRTSIRRNSTSAFIEEAVVPFLFSLLNDDIRSLCAGQIWNDILHATIDPPTFWNAFTDAYKRHALSVSGIRVFAGMLHDLLIRFRAIITFDPAGPAEEFIKSTDVDTRRTGHKINDWIRSHSAASRDGREFRPGGRHDNDFDDFRKIAIYPTADEFTATEPAYYLRAEDVLAADPSERTAIHLDNQFRLLREDMLAELRSDLDYARSGKGNKRSIRCFSGLVFSGIECGNNQRRQAASLALRCYKGLPKLAGMSEDARRKFYAHDKALLKHGSFGCLVNANDIVAFATIERNEECLAKDPPVILLQIMGDSAVTKALLHLKTLHQDELEFVLVDTAFFAYEPILKRLKEQPSLALADQLLGLGERNEFQLSSAIPETLIEDVRASKFQNLRQLLSLSQDVILDASQHESLIAGLEQPVSLIQGPPGTGKSFIGALIAKAVHQYTDLNMLVITYTNHALLQFLEDMMDIGIPESAMIRLGSKSTLRTKHLGLKEQRSNVRLSQQVFNRLKTLESDCDHLASKVQRCSAKFRNMKITNQTLLDYLEFSDSDSIYFEAFKVPDNEDGMAKVGKTGKSIRADYLVGRWAIGHNAGVYQSDISVEHKHIWTMDKGARQSMIQQWVRALYGEHAAVLQGIMHEYDRAYQKASKLRKQKNLPLIQSKRVLGCTTTGASMYAEQIAEFKPDIVLVEEAGEILESHILTALSPSTEQLILIGDHQQLRPKVNTYKLTVEQGDGYDLNKSLFERLVVSGHPHVKLTKQHRMRPEISQLVRRLMYDDLEDDAKTLQRPNIRGLRSNVVFISHCHPEKDAAKLRDRRDGDSKVSRENVYEVEMILQIVRYLAQQGYGTDQQVVLTPYLGQLRLLADRLGKTVDPVLSDLDSHDLVAAGLLPKASADASKGKLRMSTIDNFQGEESDIVIASLTRSNDMGDIGFMSAPQRLNVLLSRARNGLILIGNPNTFKASKKGRDVWVPFIDQLSACGYLYEGFPVQCERHPEKIALLKEVIDFEQQCPDGGCTNPCKALLNCGKHYCTQKCHQIVDHTQIPCKKIMEDKCPAGHKLRWQCWQKSVPCRKCEEEVRKREAARQRDLKLDDDRQTRQMKYARELAGINDEIAREQRRRQDHLESSQMQSTLKQRADDLAKAKLLTQSTMLAKSSTISSKEPSGLVKAPIIAAKVDATPQDRNTRSRETDDCPSEAKQEWKYQKEVEGADNEHMDKLMDMIGLKNVKQQVLDIKTKIDTCVRQGASLSTERFGVALLGNPGTGKTTVARIYAQFLASVGVLPGAEFKETTGSKLASEGVQACKKMIDEVLEAGGGAIFVDEAYQLTSGTSFGGGAVLDYLLAEVENLTGKVTFILAGYNKQMESFFAHNPGLPSRFPHTFQFEDYTDDELRLIFVYKINKRFSGRMNIEDGCNGLYARIFARRIGYARGREGFGNARAVENTIDKALTRQAKRLRRDRKAGASPDDFLLTQVDLIGPEPSSVLEANKTWQKLMSLTGLGAVKQSVRALFESIQFNYQRELSEQPLLEFKLNKVFLGSPGTGKTTVAKLYGQILADLGLLSNGEVVVKLPADFVGDVLGASEKTTKGILASTSGKVLLIDEAYGLAPGNSDPYKTAVIDTIVGEVQSVPGDDRCVIMIGYKQPMESMFQNCNPGLARRFPLSEAFEFEDFTDDELGSILDLKLKTSAYTVTDQARTVAMDVLKRARNRPNFGNAGEVDNLLNTAKINHQKRRVKTSGKGKVKYDATLEAIDFDPDFDRGTRAATNIKLLFEGVVGCGELVGQFEGYQRTCANMRARDIDPRENLPFNFLFKGPPGTGKTTTARKMGKIYYDMGFLATAEVIDVSATDLIGEFVGQTGPKTQKLLEKALGKVLFIDEAYRLADGHFAKEAMDELVDCLTKPAFASKLLVILAGYDDDINRLISMNPGLTSRFPETITFVSLDADACIDLFMSTLSKKKNQLDPLSLTSAIGRLRSELADRFNLLASLDNWGNARDVNTLAKAVVNQLLRDADSSSSDKIPVTTQAIISSFDKMIQDRNNRAKYDPIPKPAMTLSMRPREQDAPVPTTRTATATETAPATHTKPATEEAEDDWEAIEGPPAIMPLSDLAKRDAGVDNQTWHRLLQDKIAAEAREQEFRQLSLQQEEAKRKAAEAEAQRARLEEALRLAKQHDDEEARRLEQARIAHVRKQRELAEEVARIERERKAAEEARAKEMAVQKKLQSMGVCCMGFRWIKQASGYRCAGGSHYVSNAALGLS